MSQPDLTALPVLNLEKECVWGLSLGALCSQRGIIVEVKQACLVDTGSNLGEHQSQRSRRGKHWSLDLPGLLAEARFLQEEKLQRKLWTVKRGSPTSLTQDSGP